MSERFSGFYRRGWWCTYYFRYSASHSNCVFHITKIQTSQRGGNKSMEIYFVVLKSDCCCLGRLSTDTNTHKVCNSTYTCCFRFMRHKSLHTEILLGCGAVLRFGSQWVQISMNLLTVKTRRQNLSTKQQHLPVIQHIQFLLMFCFFKCSMM